MIISSDIKVYLSGGSGNTDPNASLGGAISTTEMVDDSLHNLFDKVTGAESSAGDTEYRAVFIKNTHATLTLQGAKVYVSSNTTSGDTSIEISVATESGSPIQTIADESTGPTGQTFSAPSTTGTALSLGDIVAGATKAIWVKRIVNASASAYSADEATLTVFGDTDA